MRIGLGRYRLIEKIGQGGLGELYFAVAKDPEGIVTPFAVKKLILKASSDPEGYEMLREEARLLAGLSHGCVARFHEFLVEGDETFVILEFINGVSLAELMRKLSDAGQVLDLKVALYLAYQIAAGLDFLSRAVNPRTGAPAGLVHGDLHPGNVMVTFEGEVKLIDFGLAKMHPTGRVHDSKMPWATLGYASPSRLLHGTISEGDDVFGFGLILWELLSGRRYWGESDLEVIHLHLRDFQPREIEFKGNAVPEAVKDLIHRCLLQEGFGRFFSAKDLFEQMHGCVSQLNAAACAPELRDIMGLLLSSEIEKNRLRLQESLVRPRTRMTADVTRKIPVIEEADNKANAKPQARNAVPKARGEAGPTRLFKFSSRDLWKSVLPPLRTLGLIYIFALCVGLKTQPHILDVLSEEPLLSIRYLQQSVFYEVRGYFTPDSSRIRGPAALSEEGQTVTVTSSPSGCEIRLDGEATGRKTPARIMISKRGLSLISISRCDFASRSKFIDKNSKNIDFHSGHVSD